MRAKRTEEDDVIVIAAKVLLIAAVLAHHAPQAIQNHAKCQEARRAVVFYASTRSSWRARMRLRTAPVAVIGDCEQVQRQARIMRALSRAARDRWYRWRELDTNDWNTATRLADRVWPGSRWWLQSCSSGEGGHGGFVWNTQGSGAGGWLQFMESTYTSNSDDAAAAVRKLGFHATRWAYTDPLGQALTGAYMHMTGAYRYHWSGTPSCL